MPKRERNTHLSVNLSLPGEYFVQQKVKNQVDQNFMVDGALCCPFLMLSFVTLRTRPVYAHIVPKCEQNIHDVNELDQTMIPLDFINYLSKF